LTIVRGDSATVVTRKLHDLGLIDDTAAFIGRLSELGLTGELMIGTYELVVGMDFDTIIEIIKVHK